MFYQAEHSVRLGGDFATQVFMVFKAPAPGSEDMPFLTQKKYQIGV